MTIKKSILSLLAGFMTAIGTFAANTVTTVEQVTEAVTVSKDVDYTITSTTPFATTGSVDITNIDHAVLIIQNIKPSKVISNWLGFVKINGAAAKNGSNCQVKMYAQGTIILPYTTESIKPLTVFSGQNYSGTSVNDFGLENTGGFMNTLTAAKLNNQIRSFKLKRGYMVTFSTRASGYGYSRCFIAANEDLEVPTLPSILDGTISSYRVFVWYDASKKGLANNTSFNDNDALNTTSCYSFGGGETRLPDQECIPHHIYENWPSASALGSTTYSCHMKTNNEPGNSADDHPQDVATVLAGWEDLMRTGMRLCSESSHDGSWSHLRAFIDSIDARGWRCDILDLHCYWGSSSFGDFSNYYSNYGNRPIWISEWCWGASWNSSNWSSGGIFAQAPDGKNSYSEANQNCMYNGTKPILDKLNASQYVERYYFWNSEADASKLIKDGTLSVLGKYYASMTPGSGYNASIQKIPNLPPMKNTGTLSCNYDKELQSAILRWREYNGEYNKSMTIQEQALGSTKWTNVKTVTLKEQGGYHTDTIKCNDGVKFRIALVVPTTSSGTTTSTLYGNIVTARSSSQEYGDPVSVLVGDSTVTRYLGGNQLINGDFSLGTTDWTAGDGNPIKLPYFEVMPEGGTSNSPYLQCLGNSALTTNAQSIYRKLSVLPNTCYYVAGKSIYASQVYQNFFTGDGTKTTGTTRLKFTNTTASWVNESASFVNTNDSCFFLKLCSLKGNAQYDDLKACQLFENRDSALADALKWEKKRVEAYIIYNTVLPAVNNILRDSLATATNANSLETLLLSAMDVVALYKQMNNTIADANTIISLGINGCGTTQVLLENYRNATAENSTMTYDQISKAISDLKDNVEATLPYTLNTTSIQNGSFGTASATSSTGWTTKCGTYTGGDQAIYTSNAGKVCWNAWWSLTATGNEDKTMAIKQEMTKMDEGLYALECNAMTQHACETDQHAYISYNGTETASAPIDFGCYDIPTFSNDDMWRPMSTPFVYVNAGENITVGFTGSKKGAVDNSYITYNTTTTTATKTGDKREGWWCATDFKLRYIPAITVAPEGNWGVICFNYVITPQEDVKMYSLAGISADSLWVFVKPETNLQKAKPYIYYTTRDKALFVGSGTKYTPASTSTTAVNLNLYGVFAGNTKKYGTKSSALVNGEWIYNPGTSLVIPSNTGYIQFTTNLKVQDIASLPEGTMKMPLKGYAKCQHGDVNSDMFINNGDIDAVIAVIAGDAANLKADLNYDGTVDVLDVNTAISIICGK